MKRTVESSKKTLSKKEPEKGLLLRLKEMAGRSRAGRITTRHKGSGAKKLYRIIDFGQEKINITGKVAALEYDPYRTAWLTLLEYPSGQKAYQLAPQGLKVGDEIITAEKTEAKIGNRMKLKNITPGLMVYNVELEPGRGGKIIRSAGTSSKVLAHEGKYTHLQMPSGEVRKVLTECFASIGQVSHPEHRFEEIGKAGRSRLMGIRPSVRGSAMNPCDHPHGGGEGRTSIGLRYPKTPWGKHALGVKTRKKKWTDKYIIQRRRKEK